MMQRTAQRRRSQPAGQAQHGGGVRGSAYEAWLFRYLVFAELFSRTLAECSLTDKRTEHGWPLNFARSSSMTETDDRERIARALLLSSPPGEFCSVEHDVAVLFANGVSAGAAADEASVAPPEPAPILIAAARDYALRHAFPLRLPSGSACLLTAEGCAAGSGFVLFSEAGSGALACMAGVSVRPEASATEVLSRSNWPPAVEAAAAAIAAPSMETLRVAAHKLLYAHVMRGGAGSSAAGAKAMLSRGAEVWAPVKDARPPSLIFYLSSVIADASNCVSGELRSRWVLTLNPTTDAQLEGELALSTHVYEGGNFTLRDSRRVGPITVAVAAQDKNDEVLAAAAVAAIASAEDDFMHQADTNYDSLSTTVLKDMRRVLPLGGRKHDWRSVGVGQQRLVQSLMTKAAAPPPPPAADGSC